jgi:WD40 repeat protein
VKFDAFISYRRADGSVAADRLRRALRNYRLPKTLPGAERRLSIYLDTIFERASDDFFENTIKPALRESRYLVVLITPRVLEEGNWVLREIAYFRTLPQRNNILFATVWDAWTAAVPPALGAPPQAEVVDLRGYAGLPIGRRHRLARDRVLSLIATLYDVPDDRMPDLRQEDARQRLARARWLSAGLGVVIVVMLLLLVYARWQRNAARAELAAGHVLNARMSADGGDAATSLLWIAAAARLHAGDPDAARVDRIRFATALHASPRLLDVQPGAVSNVSFDRSGRHWFTYGDSTIDLYETSSGRRLLHLDVGRFDAGVFNEAVTRVATGAGKTVRLWDAATGRPLAAAEQTSAVFSLAFRPGGGDLAVDTDEDGLHVWQLPTAPAAAMQHRFHVAGVTFDGYSADGARFATHGNGIASIRDATDGRELHRLDDRGRIATVTWSGDGRVLATGANDGLTTVWSAMTGARVSASAEPVEGAAHVRFSPDGTKLAVFGGDTIRVVDTKSGVSLIPALPNVHLLTAAMFTSDSRFLVTLGDGMIRAWDAASGRSAGWLVRRQARDFDLQGELFVAADDRACRLWTLDLAGSVLLPASSNDDNIAVASFSERAPRFATAGVRSPLRVWGIDGQAARLIWSAPAGEVQALAVSRDGRRVLTGGHGGTVQLWRVSRREPLVTVDHADIVSAVAFSPDGTRFATASWDKTARVWSSVTGKPVTPPLVHRERVYSIRFSPSGREVVTASEDGSARIWDAVSGRLRVILPHRQANYAEFSADGRSVVTASIGARDPGQSEASAIVWDVTDRRDVAGKQRFALRHADNVLHATFSPDGKRVATVSLDRTARIWDAATGSPLTPPLQHADRLWFVRFSPDGRLIVTTCYDGSARVWDAATGLPVTPVLWHRGGAESADFSPDSRWLVTTSRRGDIHLHDLRPDQRPLELLEAEARIASEQQLVPGGGAFPLDNDQFAIDCSVVRQSLAQSGGSRALSASSPPP